MLTVLNSADGSTVSEIAAATRLPRTTIYRVLETLIEEGYVARDASDERFRLTILVRGLSDGFDDEAWVTQVAKPYIYELGREIVWPVSIATISGTSMLVRETTDHASPLAIERYAPGYRLPLLASASGLAFLAFCSAAQRDTLIDLLARSPRDEDAPARDRTGLGARLDEIRRQGYAVFHRPRRVSDRTSLAVPIRGRERILALLVVRYARNAIPLPQAVERFVPRMHEVASKIAAGIESDATANAARRARAERLV